MNKNFKVSIIIPVHNAVATIDRCVRSIIEQSYSNIECILVENGSNDSSLEMCKKYADNYDCIKVAISEQKGVSAARNLGLSIATGDIIGFCDADDFLEPDSISAVVSAFFKEPNIIGVISAFYLGKETSTDIRKEYKGIRKSSLDAEEAIILAIGDSNVLGTVWNRYYRADVAKSVLFSADLSYSEDTHYNVQILSKNERVKISYIQKPLYCYIMNDSSATHNKDNLYDENGELKYITAKKKILNDCKLSKKCISILKMNIAVLAIDFLWYGPTKRIQKENLKRDIKQNFGHFIKNIWRFNFIRNIKRIIKVLFVYFR